MPQKLKSETPKEQAARFRREAKKLIDAGELSPTEGGKAMDRLVRTAAKPSS